MPWGPASPVRQPQSFGPGDVRSGRPAFLRSEEAAQSAA
jgi:hypothetical protein